MALDGHGADSLRKSEARTRDGPALGADSRVRPARQRRGGAFLEKEGLSGHFFEALPREDASAARFAPVYAKISNAFLLYME